VHAEVVSELGSGVMNLSSSFLNDMQTLFILKYFSLCYQIHCIGQPTFITVGRGGCGAWDSVVVKALRY
jgi:hypothetical protein